MQSGAVANNLAFVERDLARVATASRRHPFGWRIGKHCFADLAPSWNTIESFRKVVYMVAESHMPIFSDELMRLYPCRDENAG